MKTEIVTCDMCGKTTEEVKSNNSSRQWLRADIVCDRTSDFYDIDVCPKCIAKGGIAATFHLVTFEYGIKFERWTAR